MKVFHSIFALSVLKYLIRRCNACNICIFNMSFKALTYRQEPCQVGQPAIFQFYLHLEIALP